MSDNGKDIVKLDERQRGFLENLALGMTIRDAAINAGYSKGYANKGIYTELNKPSWIARIQQYTRDIPEARTALARLRLIKMMAIEDSFFQKCEKNPELYHKYPKAAEREYRFAGLGSDEAPEAPRINIGEVRNLMIQVVQGAPGRQKEVESNSDTKLVDSQ